MKAGGDVISRSDPGARKCGALLLIVSSEPRIGCNQLKNQIFAMRAIYNNDRSASCPGPPVEYTGTNVNM